MPQIKEWKVDGKVEVTTKLGDVKPGDVFRFVHVTHTQAMSGEEGGGFHMVIDVQPKKTGRVHIVSTDGKLVQEKDSDHQVVVVVSQLLIREA